MILLFLATDVFSKLWILIPCHETFIIYIYIHVLLWIWLQFMTINILLMFLFNWEFSPGLVNSFHLNPGLLLLGVHAIEWVVRGHVLLCIFHEFICSLCPSHKPCTEEKLISMQNKLDIHLTRSLAFMQLNSLSKCDATQLQKQFKVQ